MLIGNYERSLTCIGISDLIQTLQIGTNNWIQGRTAEIRDRYVHLGGDGIED